MQKEAVRRRAHDRPASWYSTAAVEARPMQNLTVLLAVCSSSPSA